MAPAAGVGCRFAPARCTAGTAPAAQDGPRPTAAAPAAVFQQRFQLGVQRTLRILAGEGYANRVLRTAGEQTVQIQRTAGFRTGTGQPFAAERLNADHRANHIAVDVQVAHLGAAGDLGDGFVDTGMHAEGQAVARGVNLLDQFVQLVTVIAHHVQYRAEDLFFSSSKLSSSISVGGTKVP